MNGLNYTELAELLKYIEENNGWKKTLVRHDHNYKKPLIKYVGFDFDSRTSTIWLIKFHGMTKDAITFRTEQDYNLKDKVYKYLKGDKQ